VICPYYGGERGGGGPRGGKGNKIKNKKFSIKKWNLVDLFAKLA